MTGSVRYAPRESATQRVTNMDRAKLIDLKERVALAEGFTPDERTFLLDCIAEMIAAHPHLAAMHAPQNYLGRIEQLWVALSVDEGGEGVCAAPFGNMMLPLFAADRRRLEQMVPAAKAIAREFGKPVRLAKFTQREDVEIYQP